MSALLSAATAVNTRWLEGRLTKDDMARLGRACVNEFGVPRFTIDEVMSALSDAFPSPRTSRDCVVEKNLRDILAHRVEPERLSERDGRTAAPVVQR